MNIKNLGLSLALLAGAAAHAQPTMLQGNEMPFVFKKQPTVTMMPNGDGANFIFKSKDWSAPWPTIVSVAGNGSVTQAEMIRFPSGVMGNMIDMVDVHTLGGKTILLLQNRNKSANLNQLIARTVEAKGILGKEEKEVGSFAFEKTGKSGDWYTCTTPDGKHLAIIGQVPAEKETLIQFKYYFLDENLKSINSGQFTFPENMKRQYMNSFYASDKGDFYMIKNEFEKGYRYPMVYKAKVGETIGAIVSVKPENDKQKFMGFVSAVDVDGDLVIAGYVKDKAFLTVGDEQANGSFNYHISTGKLNVAAFDKAINSANAEGLVFNGNTAFLVGEQLRPDREPTTMQQGLANEENYKYNHGDVLVTAFDKDGTKKFHLSAGSRKLVNLNFDQDLYPAYGIVNGKLSLVYNDVYGKFVANSGYDNSKIPVVVYITNDGLMEPPVQLSKEFQSFRGTYNLYPQFFAPSPAGIIMLAGNGTSLKGVIVK